MTTFGYRTQNAQQGIYRKEQHMADSITQEGNVASDFTVNPAGTKGNFRLAVEVGSRENRQSLFIGVSVFGEHLIKQVALSLKKGNRAIVSGRLDGYKSDKTFYQKDGEYVGGVDIFTISADSVGISPRFDLVTSTKIEKGAAAGAPVAAPTTAAPVAAPAAAAPVAAPAAAPAAPAPQPVAAGAGLGDDDF